MESWKQNTNLFITMYANMCDIDTTPHYQSIAPQHIRTPPYESTEPHVHTHSSLNLSYIKYGNVLQVHTTKTYRKFSQVYRSFTIITFYRLFVPKVWISFSLSGSSYSWFSLLIIQGPIMQYNFCYLFRR